MEKYFYASVDNQDLASHSSEWAHTAFVSQKGWNSNKDIFDLLYPSNNVLSSSS